MASFATPTCSGDHGAWGYMLKRIIKCANGGDIAILVIAAKHWLYIAQTIILLTEMTNERDNRLTEQQNSSFGSPEQNRIRIRIQ